MIIRPPTRASSLMSSHLSPAGGEFLELASAQSPMVSQPNGQLFKSLHIIFTCNYRNTEPSANKLHRKSTTVNMMVESSRLTNGPKLISKKKKLARRLNFHLFPHCQVARDRHDKTKQQPKLCCYRQRNKNVMIGCLTVTNQTSPGISHSKCDPISEVPSRAARY